MNDQSNCQKDILNRKLKIRGYHLFCIAGSQITIASDERLEILQKHACSDLSYKFETMNHEWLISKVVRDLRNISSGIVHKLRDKGTLPHSIVLVPIFYNYQDIVE